MLGRVTARRSTLGIRRCCACGYGGHAAQMSAEAARSSAAICPGCGCDFAVRPPRSYAEMEGLESLDAFAAPGNDPRTEESSFVERWLLFGCAVVIALAVAFYLIEQFLQPVALRA